MSNIYEAVVVTTDGTFRAFPVGPGLVCITEDGRHDIIGVIEVEQAQTAPEALAPALIGYIYEHVRGLDILTATLSRRNA
jgi:hypothetical protein